MLANIDLLLLPSISEGRPNVMLESLACGTPVLGSTAGAIPEVLVTGETGWSLHAADYMEFCRKIEEILAAPEQLMAMRDKARKYAEQHLNRTQMLKKYSSLIAGED
jgi:glycosyltransferase involved in cell wall biosynthesis